MEHFITQDLFEDRTRRRVVVHDLPIDRESAGSGFLRHVEKREQPAIGLAVDAQVFESVTAGQRASIEQARAASGARPQQRCAALSEQIAMAQFVDGVLQVQPSQQRIGRGFGGPQNIASAIGLDLGEGQELAHAAIEVAPDPAMHRPEHPIYRRDR